VAVNEGEGMNLSALFTTPLGELLGRRKTAAAAPRMVPPKPRMGATLTCAGLRMSVHAGMTDEMWHWLAALGWRELRAGENRLHYKALSTSLVNRLYDVEADDRQKILLLAIREATRPRQAPPVVKQPTT
jgi:hypothetical protein